MRRLRGQSGRVHLHGGAFEPEPATRERIGRQRDPAARLVAVVGGPVDGDPRPPRCGRHIGQVERRADGSPAGALTGGPASASSVQVSRAASSDAASAPSASHCAAGRAHFGASTLAKVMPRRSSARATPSVASAPARAGARALNWARAVSSVSAERINGSVLASRSPNAANSAGVPWIASVHRAVGRVASTGARSCATASVGPSTTAAQRRANLVRPTPSVYAMSASAASSTEASESSLSARRSRIRFSSLSLRADRTRT